MKAMKWVMVGVLMVVAVLDASAMGRARPAKDEGSSAVKLGDGLLLGMKPDQLTKLAAKVLKAAALVNPDAAAAAGLALPFLEDAESDPDGYAALYSYKAWDTNDVAFALNPVKGIEREKWLYKKDKIELSVPVTTPAPPGVPGDGLEGTEGTEGTDEVGEPDPGSSPGAEPVGDVPPPATVDPVIDDILNHL